jgi:hypothetical protein
MRPDIEASSVFSDWKSFVERQVTNESNAAQKLLFV